MRIVAKVELSGLHRQVLAIRLRSVEEVITSIRQALNGPPEDGLLVKYTDPVPESVHPLLQALAAKLEDHLKRLVEELGLPYSQHSLQRELVGQLSICWATLGDTRPRALAAYGQVPSEAAAYLAPEIEELCRLVLQTSAVLTKDDQESSR
jgi:hypothetical protein